MSSNIPPKPQRKICKQPVINHYKNIDKFKLISIICYKINLENLFKENTLTYWISQFVKYVFEENVSLPETKKYRLVVLVLENLIDDYYQNISISGLIYNHLITKTK